MGLVAVLAAVFGILGWAIVLLVIVLVVSGGLISAQLLNSPQAGTLVAGVLAPYLLYALGPFLGWGILQGLCEIHRQQEMILSALTGLRIAPIPNSRVPEREVASTGRQTYNRPVEANLPSRVSEPAEPSQLKLDSNQETDMTQRESRNGQEMILARDATLFSSQDATIFGGRWYPGKSLGSIPRGTRVRVVSAHQDYVSIKTEHGEEGFVRLDDLVPAD